MTEPGAGGSRASLFASMSEDDFRNLSSFAKERRYLMGEVIVREKTMTDTFCIITSGKVAVTKRFTDGDEMVLTVMGEGEFFGEMALLDQGPRSATVRALSETVVLELSRSDFERLLHNAPDIAYSIMRELGKRLRDTGSLLVSHLEKKNKELSKAYLDTVHALVSALEARDAYTRGHTSRVTTVAKAIAKNMGLVEDDLFAIEIGALLHDLGKIGVPDAILHKPGPLENGEYGMIKDHPKKGEGIIKNVEYLVRSVPSILSHHERFDGTGYPLGLAGADIPLFGRIVAVADSFDAMISDRPYRKRRDAASAVEEIKSKAGTQFDGEVVKAFVSLFESGELERMLKEHEER